MSLALSRFKHQMKILVGNQLGSLLSKQYSHGRGPAGRLISGFSAEAKQIGVEQNVLVAPIPVKKAAPDFFLDREIDIDYRNRFLSGEDFTTRAGIFSASDVDVSLPTGMHQIGRHILKEAIPSPDLLTNPKYYYALESMRFKRKRPMDEAVLLSIPWYHNFYFWMVEILPRLISYDRCPQLQRVPLIVPKSAPTFVAESLKLAGYQTKVMFLDNGVYRFKKLHLMSMLLLPKERASADAVGWLNMKFKDILSKRNTPKKIYISRRDSKIRFVSNEEQLADVLSEFGFTTLVMSDFALMDQIGIFRSADCIIGPHGAAFANLVFSQPSSTFIEFFSRGHYTPAFNRISAIRAIKYGYLVGEPTGFGGFSIDQNQLRTILSQASRAQSR